MFHKVGFIICLPLFFLLLNCNGNKSTVESPIQSETIPFTTIVNGSHSNYNEGAEITITSQKELQEVFNRLNSTRKPGYPVPSIDFNVKVVFFYATQELSYGGAPITIARVEKKKNQILVMPVDEEMDPMKLVTTVMSSPFVMIALQKQTLPIKYAMVL